MKLHALVPAIFCSGLQRGVFERDAVRLPLPLHVGVAKMAASAGGSHLLPHLQKDGEVLLLHSRLGKLGKSDALHRAATVGSSSGFTASLTVSGAARLEPGQEYVEQALTTLGTLKFRSHAPEELAPVPKENKDADGHELSDRDAVMKPIAVLPVAKRKPSAAIWRMPHCFVRSIEIMNANGDALPDTTSSPPPPGLEQDDDDGDESPPCFVVTFFSTKPKRKDNPPKTLRLMAERIPDVTRHVPFELRAREYECASAAARDEWVLVYRSAVTNYWHQRLEANVIAAPEVYQFHTWAQDRSRAHKLVQVALSTAAVYIVLRSSPEQLEFDEGVGANASNGTVARALVSDLQRVKVSRQEARVELSAGSSFSVSLQLYTVADAIRIVVELQRVWDLCHNCSSAGGGADGPAFPFEMA
jgi:hypothetical protein